MVSIISCLCSRVTKDCHLVSRWSKFVVVVIVVFAVVVLLSLLLLRPRGSRGSCYVVYNCHLPTQGATIILSYPTYHNYIQTFWAIIIVSCYVKKLCIKYRWMSALLINYDVSRSLTHVLSISFMIWLKDSKTVGSADLANFRRPHESFHFPSSFIILISHSHFSANRLSATVNERIKLPSN